jgi:hypothetical protein
MKHTQRAILASITVALAIPGWGQTVVFSDDFNRVSLGSAWTTTVTAGDGGASILGSSYLQLTNDSSGSANASGRVYSSVSIASSFDTSFNSALSGNSGTVTWSFNLQQIRSDPSGFGGGSYGAAFALASSSSDFTLGQGYAVVLGQSGSDSMRLVKFNGGLDAEGNLTTVISGSALSSPNNYFSIKVSYTAATDAWELFTRDDGSSSFSSPLSGSLTSVGGATDSSYTSIAMTSMGTLWNYNTAANQTVNFDNITVSAGAAVPEPSAYAALAGIASLGIGIVIKRRRAKTATSLVRVTSPAA